MRVLVTGSRDWSDYETIRAALAAYDIPDAILVVGDCPTGADIIARQLWYFRQEVFAADWKQYGRAAGPIRNQAMVDSGADVCLAFIRNGSKGATHCANAAMKAKIPTIIVETTT